MSQAAIPQFHRSRLAAILALTVLPALFVLSLALLPPSPLANHVTGVEQCEPRFPLEITWCAAAGDPLLPGTDLALVLTARTDLPTVRLELLLPDNVSLLSGPGEYPGKMDRGEETRLTVRVSSRGAAKLQAKATAVTPGGLVFQRGATLDLGLDGQPAAGIGPGRLVRGPDGGRQVREYPAADPGGAP